MGTEPWEKKPTGAARVPPSRRGSRWLFFRDWSGPERWTLWLLIIGSILTIAIVVAGFSFFGRQGTTRELGLGNRAAICRVLIGLGMPVDEGCYGPVEEYYDPSEHSRFLDYLAKDRELTCRILQRVQLQDPVCGPPPSEPVLPTTPTGS